MTLGHDATVPRLKRRCSTLIDDDAANPKRRPSRWTRYSALRWIPVVFVSAVVLWSTYAYVVQFCLLTVDTLEVKALYITLHHFFVIMFLWSYYRTVFSRRNQIPDEFKVSRSVVRRLAGVTYDERNVILAEAGGHLPLKTKTATSLVRYCDSCELIKPDRAHHCGVCDACWLKMDHHCPWINNCVSFNNYKFFVLFLWWQLMYQLYMGATMLPYFLQIYHGAGENGTRVYPLFLASVGFDLPIGTLFFYHVYLILRNKTTMEAFHRPVFRPGFDRGFSSGCRNNFREVFGKNWKLWCLPVFSSLGDGVTFPAKLEDVEGGQVWLLEDFAMRFRVNKGSREQIGDLEEG